MTGPPWLLLPSWATHLMFFCLPSSTTHSVGMFLPAVLTIFRLGVPPNMGQAVNGFAPERLRERMVLRSTTSLPQSGQQSSSPAETFSLAEDGLSVGDSHR